MSSIATFYPVPNDKRDSYARSRPSGTTKTQKPRLIGLLGFHRVETDQTLDEKIGLGNDSHRMRRVINASRLLASDPELLAT